MKSIVTPFNVTGGRVATTSDYSRIVEQKVRDVLVTGKMERPTMPLYGAGLQELLFENIDELVATDIQMDTSLDLLDNVSGIRVLDVKIEQDSLEESTAIVKVAYQIGNSAPQITSFNISSDILTEESSL